MPLYPGTVGSLVWTGPYNPPTVVLAIGDLPFTLFNAELVAVGKASASVGLGDKDAPNPGSQSIEGFFAGDPGAFELLFQTADVDADGLFQQAGLSIIALNGVFAFRGEFLNVSANFGRLFIKTLTNAVKITARITRN